MVLRNSGRVGSRRFFREKPLYRKMQGLSCFLVIIPNREVKLISYIDLLNYMLKYKIPQIVTLTPDCYVDPSNRSIYKEKSSYLFR